MSKNGKNAEPEMPEFDWADISYDDFAKIQDLSIKQSEYEVILKEPDDESLSDRERWKVMKKKSKAIADSRIINEQIRQAMGRYLLSLPRSWMVRSAPDVIDTADLIKYVLVSKHKALIQAFSSGAVEEPKN